MDRSNSQDGRFFSDREWAELAHQIGISPRQSQVIEQLLCGLSDKQIAGELNIALPTVRTHISRLFSKLDVEDRTELVLYVMRKFRDRCDVLDCPRKRCR